MNLSVNKGEVISLIGPSGSGKSTFLRVLMGLLPPTGGRVRLDGGQVDYASRAQLRAMRDRMAIVFQQYNLFQNMDVMRNVTIAPLKIKKRPKAVVQQEAPNGAGLKAMVRNLKGDAESTAIAQVLEGVGWNRKAAANDLQISYKALLYKIKQYDLSPRNHAS